MNKFVCLVVFLIVLEGVVHAEAPELRNVMPNSWKKVTRLTGEEESIFLQRNRVLMDRIAEEIVEEPFEELNFRIKEVMYTNTRVYKEQVGSDTFYRLLIGKQRNPVYTDQKDIQFLQALAYDRDGELVLLAMGTYNKDSKYPSQHGTFVKMYRAITITEGQGKAQGVLLSYVTLEFEEGTEGDIVYTGTTKGQLCGGTGGMYMLMDDARRITGNKYNKRRNGSYFFYDEDIVPRIEIEASLCLVDLKNPLWYGIQSAFDGDPTTSYVENTGDDLIIIRILVGGARKLAIINGYAQNQPLYYANNRVKKLIWPTEIELADNTLDYQFAKIPHGQELKTSELYRGNKFSDTCIAELNVKVEHGWLFGDIANE
jgi:hypothetical protein